MITVGPPTYDSNRYFCNPNPEISWIGYDLLNVAPRYTASIDAALELVPKGAGLRLERYWLSDREAWTSVVSTGGIPSNSARQFVAEDARAPAIALCISALKERAAATNRADATHA